MRCDLLCRISPSYVRNCGFSPVEKKYKVVQWLSLDFLILPDTRSLDIVSLPGCAPKDSGEWGEEHQGRDIRV